MVSLTKRATSKFYLEALPKEILVILLETTHIETSAKDLVNFLVASRVFHECFVSFKRSILLAPILHHLGPVFLEALVLVRVPQKVNSSGHVQWDTLPPTTVEFRDQVMAVVQNPNIISVWKRDIDEATAERLARIDRALGLLAELYQIPPNVLDLDPDVTELSEDSGNIFGYVSEMPKYAAAPLSLTERRRLSLAFLRWGSYPALLPLGANYMYADLLAPCENEQLVAAGNLLEQFSNLVAWIHDSLLSGCGQPPPSYLRRFLVAQAQLGPGIIFQGDSFLANTLSRCEADLKSDTYMFNVPPPFGAGRLNVDASTLPPIKPCYAWADALAGPWDWQHWKQVILPTYYSSYQSARLCDYLHEWRQLGCMFWDKDRIQIFKSRCPAFNTGWLLKPPPPISLIYT